MMGARKNGHQSTGLKGLSTENTCQARAKAPGPFVVSGSNPTCLPSHGPGTTEQDPDGAGRCWQHCWAPNPLPAVSQLEWLQLEGASLAPAQTRSPGGTAAPSPWRCAPRRLSPFHTPTTCKVPLWPSLVPAVCLPCACCVPVMHQSCAHHMPARTDAELLCLLCCTGQLMQQNRSRDSSPARQNLSPHYLAPHFCPRLRFWESRGG